MPIIRNPFARRPDTLSTQPDGPVSPFSRPSFEKVDTVGSRTSSVLSISSGKSQEPAEYKMSVVNDSGVYLPPSPTESKGYWPRRYPSGTSLSTRTSDSGEIDPFPISRESFDSYRRSFDISAKSQINSPEFGRASLDSGIIPRYPRSAIHERMFEKQPPTAEEAFEDIGLNDDHLKYVKKRGFFSKFGEDKEIVPSSNGGSIFHMGRKRGHSGVGEELSNIQRPGGSVGPSKENQ